jgi:hypothetical protein
MKGSDEVHSRLLKCVSDTYSMNICVTLKNGIRDMDLCHVPILQSYLYRGTVVLYSALYIYTVQ